MGRYTAAMTRSLMSLTALPLLLACNSGKVSIEDLEDAGDIEDACDEYELEELTLEVVFPAQTGTCPWGEDNNMDPESGVFTARIEELQQLELPEQSVICDMAFDFSGLVPGEVQFLTYDDHFFFTFNDIVLAASYGPVVEDLEPVDGGMYRYAWTPISGVDYHAEEEFDPYCLGDGTGESTCDIPDTEVEGPISLNYSEELVSQLSLSAIEDERYDFGFITTGDDNEDSDCKHEEFGFTIEVPYLAL